MQGPALSALRQLLVEENSHSFQNPRDPTSTNVTRAFLNYDRERCAPLLLLSAIPIQYWRSTTMTVDGWSVFVLGLGLLQSRASAVYAGISAVPSLSRRSLN